MAYVNQGFEFEVTDFNNIFTLYETGNWELLPVYVSLTVAQSLLLSRSYRTLNHYQGFVKYAAEVSGLSDDALLMRARYQNFP